MTDTALRLRELSAELNHKTSYCEKLIKRPANGELRHDYLVPGGPYSEQWDWDAFFMGVALLAIDPKEGTWLRNWALNYIEHSSADGKVPGCVTPRGADPRLHHMKPFLAQGVLISAKALGDYSWVAQHWERVKLICTYRERNLWHKGTDLAMWYDSMESGADNNVASLEFPVATVVSADVNALTFREYMSIGRLAARLGKQADADHFRSRGEHILRQSQRVLWNEELQLFCNLFTANNRQISRITYSCFVPLWAGMASESQGRECIKRYLISPQHMRSKYGLRTLSKQDFTYNNLNIIKPHSNWQGPVWPIANYLYIHALQRYGFGEEAQAVACDVIELVLRDIGKSGGMHENYDAESGEPLAAPNFVSWNILLRNLGNELLQGVDPFDISETENSSLEFRIAH